MGRGLSELQHRIMADIVGREYVLVRELRENNPGHAAPAISRAITRLVERGLIERVNVRDGVTENLELAVKELAVYKATFNGEEVRVTAINEQEAEEKANQELGLSVNSGDEDSNG